jgi:hypothetical protein
MSGWSWTRDEDDGRAMGVVANWEEAPPGAAVALIARQGGTHEVPIVDGFWLWVDWDVPDDTEAPLPSWAEPSHIEYVIDGGRVADPRGAQKRAAFESLKQHLANPPAHGEGGLSIEYDELRPEGHE